MASRSNKDLMWVRCGGNKSPRYDGKVEGVPRSSIIKRSGQNVEVLWGEESVVWGDWVSPRANEKQEAITRASENQKTTTRETTTKAKGERYK